MFGKGKVKTEGDSGARFLMRDYRLLWRIQGGREGWWDGGKEGGADGGREGGKEGEGDQASNLVKCDWKNDLIQE